MKRLCWLAGFFVWAIAPGWAFEVECGKEAEIWKLDGIHAEWRQDAVRFREVGPKNLGTASVRIPASGAKYLQVLVGPSEDPLHYMTVSNGSAMPESSIFQGCNTFPSPQGDYTLTFTLRGPKGETPSGWYDIRSIRTVDVPSGGVVVSAEKPVVKVGDTFRVEYHGMPGDSQELPLQVFLGSSMAPVTFGQPVVLRDDGTQGDLKKGDGIYSALVTVTEEASRLQGAKGQPLPGSALCFAVGLAGGVKSYGVADFAFDVATSRPVWTTGAVRLTPTATEYRLLWEKAIAGKLNLAAGKPVEFSHAPNFKLTVGKENTDRFDLTDGQLTMRGDDVLRFDSHAVGWRTGEDLSNGIDMVIDLGEVAPVEKAVIRINCGDRQNLIQRSPRRLAVLVSKDGKYYYPASAPMIKLAPGEKDQSDFKQQFYLEESDECIFCYPFELDVHANARYVMVRVSPDGANLYCDELAILKADASSVSDAAYDGTPEERITEGFVLEPSYRGLFIIADNLPAPNYFMLRELSSSPSSAAYRMVVELPSGISCLNPEVTSESIEKQGKPYTRYAFNLLNKPPKRAHQLEHLAVFFQAPKGMQNPGKAYVYMTVNGKASHVTERDISVITLPECTEKFRGPTVLSRMSIGDKEWPGYLDNLRKLGFSCAQIYPYYYFTPEGGDRFTPGYCAAIEAAHQAGLKIVIGFNGLLRMYHKSNNPSNDVWCQTDNPKNNPCPSFRGKEYWLELAKITRSVEKFRPTYIQWDIEHWGAAMQGMRHCSRCLARWEKSGKSWEDYLDELSVELNGDLTEAVAAGARKASIPMPAIYSYNRQPMTKIYHGLEKWELNKQFVAGPQPSLYVGGNELKVHHSIKTNFELLGEKGKRTIAPVLTPGTYGAYEPYHLEQMIYETMLNGAVGFFYYPWRGFISPIYFYYHSKAMQNVISHQELILNGELFTPQCNVAEMTLSGVKSRDEALVLVGNYLGVDEECAVQAPFEPASITDVLTGQELPASELRTLKVPMRRVRLLYLKRAGR